jgi:hypothetical protein
MKRPSRPLRSKSAAQAAPALIDSGGSAPSGAGRKCPCPSFRKRRGWYSGAPAGWLAPPAVTSRSARPSPVASNSSSGPSSTSGGAASAGEAAGAHASAPRGRRTRRASRVVPPMHTPSRPLPSRSPTAIAGPAAVEARREQPLVEKLVVGVLRRRPGEIGGPARLRKLGLRPRRRRRRRGGPEGSVMMNRRSAGRFSNVCTAPLGHDTVSRRITASSPRPK